MSGQRSDEKRCTKCGETKPLDVFRQDPRSQDGRHPWCLECGRKSARDYARRVRQGNREEHRQRQRARREQHPGEASEINRRSRSKLHGTVLDHYGRACACCSSTKDLTIDHVNGDGGEHRADVGPGASIWRWLVRNRFPDGFQTLCLPCNSSKRDGERCRLDHENRAAAKL